MGGGWLVRVAPSPEDARCPQDSAFRWHRGSCLRSVIRFVRALCVLQVSTRLGLFYIWHRLLSGISQLKKKQRNQK